MDDTTAIVTDVENTAEKPVLARDAAMEQMAKRRSEEVSREAGQKHEEVTDSFSGVDENADNHVDTDSLHDVPNELIELKVDGEIIRKPKAEVDAEGGVAVVQKRLALETRLAKAAEERKAIEREKAEIARQKLELLRREQEAESRKPKAKDVTDDEVAIRKRFVDSVYSGDEEETLNALNEIVDRLKPKDTPAAPQIDPDRFAEEIEKKLTYKTSLNDGLRTFKEDYRHLAEDTNLYNMTNQATARLQNEHPDWEPKKIILEAAKEVDEWITSKRQPGPIDMIEERNLRKQSIDNIPTAKTKKPGDVGYKRKTPQEIFADLKAGRSQ